MIVSAMPISAAALTVRASARSNLGLALYEDGKNDAAVAAYREAIRLRPDYLLAHFNLGLALSAKGNLDAASAEFREAIRIKPDYAARTPTSGSPWTPRASSTRRARSSARPSV